MIEIDVVGRGPNVVLLHGMPSAPDHFEKLASYLSRNFRVLTPHLPGYGRSPPPRSNWTLAERDLQLVATLAEHGVRAAHLLGFSGGALVAFRLALDTPLEALSVFALAGLCAISREERADFRGFAEALRAGQDLAPVAGPRFLSPEFLRAHPGASEEVGRWIREVDRETLADEMSLYANESENLCARLEALSCPVTARTGTLDLAVPLAHARQVVAAVEAGTLQPVKGAGHALLLEDFAASAAAIEDSFRVAASRQSRKS